MSVLVVMLGVVIAVLLLIGSFKVTNAPAKSAMRVAAVVVMVLFIFLSSWAYVPSDKVCIVNKHWFGSSLKGGTIIATDGEMGPQADTLPPGLHFGYWPFIYTVENAMLTIVPSDQVGQIETTDGAPMAEGQLFANEWKREEVQQMLDARHFLTSGKGLKGKQVTVLTPGTYRLNTQLYKVKMVPLTEILQGEVGVVKANFGDQPTLMVDGSTGQELTQEEALLLPDERVLSFAKVGEMGIRREVLRPGKYPINTDAFTVVELYSSVMVAHFAASQTNEATQRVGMLKDPSAEEREIRVTTSDGFKFPVDVRIEYVVEAVNAPVVVATLGDDEGDRFRNVMNSAVRAIFRNNAEKVRALDYVQQRSLQESQSLTMLEQQMGRFGVKVTAVRIGDVGDELSLGALLKTQTDRELAKQEQQTFQEQQKAAEQKKQLAKTQQESDEEKKLATATYSVKIATEEQKRKITEAEAEAKGIQIKAEAQAKAYEQIAQQIGKSNAAMIEILKIVGERNIQITPRVYIHGGADAPGGAGATTALIGTLLDQMVKDDEPTVKK